MLAETVLFQAEKTKRWGKTRNVGCVPLRGRVGGMVGVGGKAAFLVVAVCVFVCHHQEESKKKKRRKGKIEKILAVMEGVCGVCVILNYRDSSLMQREEVGGRRESHVG